MSLFNLTQIFLEFILDHHSFFRSLNILFICSQFESLKLTIHRINFNFCDFLSLQQSQHDLNTWERAASQTGR